MKINLKNSNNFEVIDINNSEKWEYIINKFDNIDTYYTLGYSKTFMIHGDGIPILLYYENTYIKAVNVVMVRRINDIDYLNFSENEVYYDLSTPYGYGGFIIEGDNNLNEFNKDYIEFCKFNNIICEFVRFHPILRNEKKLERIYDVVFIGNTVEINLVDEESVWKNFSSKNRNVIRKAIKSDVCIKQGLSIELLNTFQKMYNKTMDRDNAKQYYYFENEFYDTFFKSCKNDASIFFAEYKDEIISMAIILKRNGQLHYHLSASNFEYRTLAPTNLLLWEVAKWGCEHGYDTLHLGGGVGGNENDSLYKFKKSFNKNAKSRFYIGKKIFNEVMYKKLIKLAEKNKNLDYSFFPVYRS